MNTAFKTSLSALAIAATGAFAQAQISFQGPVSYTVGTQPDVTAIGDLDNDGDADLATATDAPDKISLLFNAGNGTFTGPINVLLANGTSPYAPVIGDLDGDGDVDIAVSLQNANQVQIIVHNGAAFVPGATFPVGTEPRDMEIADLDNDGDLDMVVANRSGNSISVLRNNGGLSFTVTSYPAGLDPRELAVGDMTGDGLMDVAVASHDSRQVTVFRNTGAAAFVQHTTLSPANEKPSGVTIARLDANGSFDVVATASVNNVEFAYVFLNTGGGSFGGGVPYNLGAVLNTGSIVAGDFDLDGDQDFATANQDSNNVSILANNGAGGFGAAQVVAVGTQPNHITAGFLDGNNGLDLVTANEGSANVSVLINNAGSPPCTATTYCQGKVNSQGGVASIGSTGTPSATTQGFVVTITGATPNTNGLLFFGTNGPATTPFNGGTLCVAQPLIRAGIHQVVAGATSYPIRVTPAMAGTTRWYQFFYRDPFHVDGTGVGLSNALRVDFCQ